jgi:hypothetical protein
LSRRQGNNHARHVIGRIESIAHAEGTADSYFRRKTVERVSKKIPTGEEISAGDPLRRMSGRAHLQVK